MNGKEREEKLVARSCRLSLIGKDTMRVCGTRECKLVYLYVMFLNLHIWYSNPFIREKRQEFDQIDLVQFRPPT